MIWSGQSYVVLLCCDSAESKDKVLVDRSTGLLSKKLVQVSTSDIEGSGGTLKTFRHGQKTSQYLPLLIDKGLCFPNDFHHRPGRTYLLEEH